MTCYSWEDLSKPLALIGASYVGGIVRRWSSLLTLSDYFGIMIYDFLTGGDDMSLTKQYSWYDDDFLQVFWELY